jgi:AraC-like DNA-binding protein
MPGQRIARIVDSRASTATPHGVGMSAKPDNQGKVLLARAGVGVTAGIVQHSELRFSRIVIDRPALIVLRHGTKTLQSAGGQWSVKAGEAIALAGGQSFDVTNRLSDAGSYEARWLIWDPAILARYERSAHELNAHERCPLVGAAALGKLDTHFASAFERALEAIGQVQDIPADVAQHRLAEVLLWLSLRGVHFPVADSPTLAMKVRRLFETSLAQQWTATAVADRLALSEATLRRRLAREGTTLGDLLTDVRMSFAMVLLQSTQHAVNRIALQVGYESASRFAIRFRERFGFAPTAIRGHARR